MAKNLRLLEFKINKFDFQFVDGIKGGTVFNIKPEIECKIGKNGKTLNAFLSARVNENNSSPVPFNMYVILVARFGILKEAQDSEFVKEAFEELYPFLRSSIAGAMANFNVQPYFLPIISPYNLSADAKVDGDLN